MGHPTPAAVSTHEQASAIIHALSRVRGASEVGEALGRQPSSTPRLVYVRSMVHEADVAILEVMLEDARTAREDLEVTSVQIMASVKAEDDPLANKAEEFRDQYMRNFDLFMEAQDAVSAIRDDLNLLMDVLVTQPSLHALK